MRRQLNASRYVVGLLYANATADIPDLDMAIDKIDESEDKKNEVCVDEEDDDDDAH
jgi:hypothetical protein